MKRIGSVILSLALIAAVPATALGAPAAKHNPAPPRTGVHKVGVGTAIKGGSFKVVKHGSKRSVSKLTGTWSDDAATTCGIGKFTVTPAAPIHLVKYNKTWMVGKYSPGNGNSGAKVSVKLADGSVHKAKLAIIFSTGKPVPGQASFKNSGSLRYTAGSCETTLPFK